MKEKTDEPIFPFKRVKMSINKAGRKLISYKKDWKGLEQNLKINLKVLQKG